MVNREENRVGPSSFNEDGPAVVRLGRIEGVEKSLLRKSCSESPMPYKARRDRFGPFQKQKEE